MSHLSTWTRQPQLKDLPRDGAIAMTCRSCGKGWSQDVRQMVEVQRLGAHFMDLLEWQARCDDVACQGAVLFDYDGKPETAPYVAEVTAPSRPRIERLAYPVKAVVRPRQAPVPAYAAQYALPQYALPMPMPRTVQPARYSAQR